MKTTIAALLAAVLGALAVLALVRGLPAPTPTPADNQVMVYPVPAARIQELVDALRPMLLLNSGTVPLGDVREAGQGQLIVSAPKAMQASIAESLQRLASEAAAPDAAGDVRQGLQVEVRTVDLADRTPESSTLPDDLTTVLDALREPGDRRQFRAGQRFTLRVARDREMSLLDSDGQQVGIEWWAAGTSGTLKVQLTMPAPSDASRNATLRVQIPAVPDVWQLLGTLPGKEGSERWVLVRAHEAG
jgi:hypothetical protein